VHHIKHNLNLIWFSQNIEIQTTTTETQPVPRAPLCAESQIQSSWHKDALPRAKDLALGTEKTRGTDVLCREGTEPPLSTDADSRHRGTVPRAAEAGPRHSRDLTAQSNGRHGRWPGRQMCRKPTSGSRHRNLCRVPDTGSRQRIKKNQIHAFKPFASSTYTPKKSICSNFT
jgi:hypothetical protein